MEESSTTDMSSLLPTPREDLLEYNNQTEASTSVIHQKENEMTKGTDAEPSGPPSPPTSPAKGKMVTEMTDEDNDDPPLYASTSHEPSEEDSSLFPEENIEEVIQRHIAATRRSSGMLSRSHNSDENKNSTSCMHTIPGCKLTTSFISILHKQDPRQLFKETMAENRIYYVLNKAPYGIRKKATRMPLAPVAISKSLKLPRLSSTSSKKSKQTSNRVIKQVSSRKNTEVSSQGSSPANGRNGAVKKGVDRDFESIRDFSPPVNILGGRDDAFTFTKWAGKPLDLSLDPLRHLLHPSELRAAEALRLECDRWLATKRMIFKGAVECYKLGKEFKKTDAQKATVIDVNKASKIWEAFNSVGWFDARFLAPHVSCVQDFGR